MSIEGVGRAAGRIAEISSKFRSKGPEATFRSLLIEAARSPAQTRGTDGVERGVPSARSSVVQGSFTIGQMLGLSATGQVSSVMRTMGPTAFPVRGVSGESVTNSFGWNWGAHKHAGVDIFASKGTPVVAPVSGEIEIANAAPIGGNRIWLRGDDGRGYYLAHLDGFADEIRPGARVQAGEVVGYVGNTGDAAGKPPHLHFAISSDADLKPGDSSDPAGAGWLDPGAFLGIHEPVSEG